MAVNVKGTALLPRWKYLTEKGTPAQVQEVRALLSSGFIAEIDRGLMQNLWYPFEYFIQILKSIDRVLGRGDGALLRDMAHYAAENSLNTVYKIFFKIGSPEYILRKASRLYEQYYSSGHLQFSILEPKKVQIVMGGFETPVREHCLTIQYWIEKTLLMTGAKQARVDHAFCRLHGADTCKFDLSWE